MLKSFRKAKYLEKQTEFEDRSRAPRSAWLSLPIGAMGAISFPLSRERKERTRERRGTSSREPGFADSLAFFPSSSSSFRSRRRVRKFFF